MTWEVRGGAMQEDGLHGVDGYDVWNGDERADDSFFQDRDAAQDMAVSLNAEDGL
jgi:hypothetical protein